MPARPCVVKVDGLAAGKGVFVCETVEQLDEGLRAAAGFPGPIVIEELLEGEEVSVFALADGRGVVPLAPAQDFKRIGDGDTGPNTGGMGSFSPVPGMGADEVAELVEQIHRPVVEELARRGAPFVGVLFAGLMLTADGPKVLEFNCRFGDPETQSIVPRLEGDFLGALAAAAGGDLEGVELTASDDAAVTVVLARRASTRRAPRAARRSRGSRRPRRRERSSSTPARRCTASSWSRTAAGSSPSPAPGQRSARRVIAPTRAASGSRSPAPGTARTSR